MLVGVWGSLVLAFVSVAAFASQEGPLDNIFGSDHREAVTSSQNPWGTIGRLNNGCTATLVGKNLILTAAHCATVAGTSNLVPGLTFSPNMIAFSARHSSRALRATFGGVMPTTGMAAPWDWAVVVIEDNLGDTYGWMGVTSDFRNEAVNLAGYSADFRNGGTASVHRGCRVRGEDGGFWLHDCDMTRGASGGPMFIYRGGQYSIVAVQSGERRGTSEQSLTVNAYETRYANSAVPASKFIATVRQLKGE